MPKPMNNDEAAQRVMLEQDTLIRDMKTEVNTLKAIMYMILRDHTKCSMHKPIKVSHEDVAGVMTEQPVFNLEANNKRVEKSTGLVISIKRED